MSTEFDIVCLDCKLVEKAKERPDTTRYSYDVHRLNPMMVYKLIETTPLLVKLDETGLWELGDLPDEGHYCRPASFLVKHVGHKLTVFDEYGREHFVDGSHTELPRE